MTTIIIEPYNDKWMFPCYKGTSFFQPNDFNGTSLFDVYSGCEYKINSFPPQLRKPAWLMDGIKWMKIKMFHEIDDKIELNGKNGREKSK